MNEREYELATLVNTLQYDIAKLKEELESFLAKPECKPLTREEISQGFRDNEDALNAESFWAGVEFAEKMHGVNNEISTT